MDLNIDSSDGYQDTSHINFGNTSQLIKEIGEMAWISNQKEDVAPSKLYYLSRGTNECMEYNLESKENRVRSIGSGEIIPRWSGFVVLDDRILITGGKDSKESGANNHVFYFLPESGECI